MTSTMFFKFRSMRAYETLLFDGHFLSVGELRQMIADKRGLTGAAAELVLSEPPDGPEYSDDNFQIPKGSRVLVKRRAAQASRVLTGATQPRQASAASTSGPVQQAAPAQQDGFQQQALDDFGEDPFAIAAAALQLEASRAQAALASTAGPGPSSDRTSSWGPAGRGGGRAAGGRGRGRGGPVPSDHFCKRCGETGKHFFWLCPTLDDPEFNPPKPVQRATGIPQTSLRRTADGGIMLPTGELGELVPNQSAFQKQLAMMAGGGAPPAVAAPAAPAPASAAALPTAHPVPTELLPKQEAPFPPPPTPPPALEPVAALPAPAKPTISTPDTAVQGSKLATETTGLEGIAAPAEAAAEAAGKEEAVTAVIAPEAPDKKTEEPTPAPKVADAAAVIDTAQSGDGLFDDDEPAAMASAFLESSKVAAPSSPAPAVVVETAAPPAEVKRRGPPPLPLDRMFIVYHSVLSDVIPARISMKQCDEAFGAPEPLSRAEFLRFQCELQSALQGPSASGRSGDSGSLAGGAAAAVAAEEAAAQDKRRRRDVSSREAAEKARSSKRSGAENGNRRSHSRSRSRHRSRPRSRSRSRSRSHTRSDRDRRSRRERTHERSSTPAARLPSPEPSRKSIKRDDHKAPRQAQTDEEARRASPEISAGSAERRERISRGGAGSRSAEVAAAQEEQQLQLLQQKQQQQHALAAEASKRKRARSGSRDASPPAVAKAVEDKHRYLGSGNPPDSPSAARPSPSSSPSPERHERSGVEQEVPSDDSTHAIEQGSDGDRRRPASKKSKKKKKHSKSKKHKSDKNKHHKKDRRSSTSPELRVKKERVSRSPDVCVKRERGSRSPDVRVANGRRSPSPEPVRVKRERRSPSPGQQQRGFAMGRLGPALERRIKMEQRASRQRSLTPERVAAGASRALVDTGDRYVPDRYDNGGDTVVEERLARRRRAAEEGSEGAGDRWQEEDGGPGGAPRGRPAEPRAVREKRVVGAAPAGGRMLQIALSSAVSGDAAAGFRSHRR